MSEKRSWSVNVILSVGSCLENIVEGKVRKMCGRESWSINITS